MAIPVVRPQVKYNDIRFWQPNVPPVQPNMPTVQPVKQPVSQIDLWRKVTPFSGLKPTIQPRVFREPLPVKDFKEREERAAAFRAYRKAGGKLLADQWEFYGMPATPEVEPPRISEVERQETIRQKLAPEPSVGRESLWKDIWDRLQAGAGGLAESIYNTYLRTQINRLTEPVKAGDWKPAMEGQPLTEQFSEEEARQENIRAGQQKKEFQEAYSASLKSREDFRKAHPEEEPVYPKGFFQSAKEDPKRLLDPTLWAETIAGTLPYTVGLMALAGNPAIGIPVSLQVTYATEGQEIYEDAIANGATPEQAQPLSEIYGALSSIVETVGDTIFVGGFGKLSGGISKLLGKNVAREVAKEVVKETGWQVAKKTAYGALIDFLNQGGQEAVEQVIRNAAVKTVNEGRPLLQNVVDSFVGGVVGTIPFVGGGVALNLAQAPRVQAGVKELVTSEVGAVGKPAEIRKKLPTPAQKPQAPVVPEFKTADEFIKSRIIEGFAETPKTLTEIAQELDNVSAQVEGLQATLESNPARGLIDLVKKTGAWRGELGNLTLAQYRRLTGKEEIQPNILTPDKKHVRWEYSLDFIASEKGFETGEELKEAIEKARNDNEKLQDLTRQRTILQREYDEAKAQAPEVVAPTSVTLSDGTKVITTRLGWDFFTPEGKRIPLDKVTSEQIDESGALFSGVEYIPPIKPPIVSSQGDIVPEPSFGKPRTLADLTREARGMKALTPEQRAAAMDISKPINKGELLYQIKPFEEHATNLLKPDKPINKWLRSIPGARSVVGVFTPAQMKRDNPVAMIGINKNIFIEIEKARAEMAADKWGNDAREILGFKEVKKEWRATKVSGNPLIDDILEKPDKYPLSPEQSKLMRQGQNMQTQLLRDAQRVGVNVVELGEAYWRRIVIKALTEKVSGTYIRGRLASRKGYTYSRAFENIDQGKERGCVYETNPVTRLKDRLIAGIQTVADQEARIAISNLPGVEKPLERLEKMYPETIEGVKSAREARDIAKKNYLSSETSENWNSLRQAEADYVTAVRDLYIKKERVGLPSFSEMRLPNGRIAPRELVEEVYKYIELPELRKANDSTLRAVNEISQLFRSSMTTGELSWAFIQGQGLFYRNNPAWWKAMGLSIVSMFHDPYAYVAKNFDVMDLGIRAGAITAPTEFLFTDKGLASMPTKIPILGSVLKGFNRGMQWFIMGGQTELFKSAMGTRMGMEELVDLGSAIRKEMGAESWAILGVSPTQRTVENLALFTARMFRAQVGLIQQAFTKGKGGTEARKYFGMLLAGGTALTIGISLATRKKMPNIDDPYAPDWMQVPIGKSYFNFFGMWYTPLRTIARMSVSLAKNEPMKAAIELKKYASMKASLPIRAADILAQFAVTGKARTFEGEEISKTPLGILSGILEEFAGPIAYSEIAKGFKEDRNETTLELIGLPARGSPYAQMDILFQAERDINPEGESYRYAEPWQIKEMSNRYPELSQRMTELGTGEFGDAKRLWVEIDKRYYTQEDALGKDFQAGKISNDEFRDRYSKIQGEKAAEKSAVNKTLGLFQGEQPLPKDPNEAALAQYYQIQDKATTSSGIYDYDLAEQLLDKIKKTWTPAQLSYIERNTGLTDHPASVQLYLKAREVLAPYWQIEDRIWSMYPAIVKQLYDQIKILENVNPAQAKRMMTPAILRARELIVMSKKQWLMIHPSAKIYLDMFYR